MDQMRFSETGPAKEKGRNNFMGQDYANEITSTEGALPYNPQNTQYGGEKSSFMGSNMGFNSHGGGGTFDNQS
mgnify:CR=1 FL=1